jgi:putative exosortase-associated protein (TIGR04073 family)
MLLGASHPAAAEEDPTPAGSQQAAAADGPVCPICGTIRQQDVSYPAKAGSTLVRGASNTLFGWTEIIREPAQEAREGRNVRNVVVGIANGVGHGIARTAVGVGELLTFWTPKINNRYVRLAEDCPICMKGGK